MYTTQYKIKIRKGCYNEKWKKYTQVQIILGIFGLHTLRGERCMIGLLGESVRNNVKVGGKSIF